MDDDKAGCPLEFGVYLGSAFVHESPFFMGQRWHVAGTGWCRRGGGKVQVGPASSTGLGRCSLELQEAVRVRRGKFQTPEGFRGLARELNLFFFLVAPRAMRDFSSLIRDRIHAPCSGSVESQPLDRQGSPGS